MAENRLDVRLAILALSACSSGAPSATPAESPACRDRAAALGKSLAGVREAHHPVAPYLRAKLVEHAGRPAPAGALVVELNASVDPDPLTNRDLRELDRALAKRASGKPLLLAVDGRTPWILVVTAMDRAHLAGESGIHFLFKRPVPPVPFAGSVEEVAPRLAQLLATCPPAVDVVREGNPDSIVGDLPGALQKCGCTTDIEEIERLFVSQLGASQDASQDEVVIEMPRAATGIEEVRADRVFHPPPPDQPWSEAHKVLLAAGADGRPLILPPRPPPPPPPPPPKRR